MPGWTIVDLPVDHDLDHASAVGRGISHLDDVDRVRSAIPARQRCHDQDLVGGRTNDADGPGVTGRRP